MIPRGNEETRYDLQNGIALCVHHHKFDNELSPHLNAAGFMHMLEQKYVGTHVWYRTATKTGNPQFLGTKTPAYYMGHILRLKEYVSPEDYTRIVGVRFADYLETIEL